jgi:hypothetical protein
MSYDEDVGFDLIEDAYYRRKARIYKNKRIELYNSFPMTKKERRVMNGCGLAEMKPEGGRMNYDRNEFSLKISLEKYTVISDIGNYQGSWVKEDDAIDFCKRQIKDGAKVRFYILESKKEIGLKAPEMDIEDL